MHEPGLDAEVSTCREVGLDEDANCVSLRRRGEDLSDEAAVIVHMFPARTPRLAPSMSRDAWLPIMDTHGCSTIDLSVICVPPRFFVPGWSTHRNISQEDPSSPPMTLYPPSSCQRRPVIQDEAKTLRQRRAPMPWPTVLRASCSFENRLSIRSGCQAKRCR